MASWHSPESRAHTWLGRCGGDVKSTREEENTAEMLPREAPGKRCPRGYSVPFRAGRPGDELQVSRELTLVLRPQRKQEEP